MNRPIVLSVITAIATTVAVPAVVSPAQAQIDIQIGTPQPPSRNGAWGDRDRDGIPNAYDRHDNRQQAWGDKDHDGVPNRYDRFDNRLLQDKDHDGVPRAFDRNDNNPYR